GRLPVGGAAADALLAAAGPAVSSETDACWAVASALRAGGDGAVTASASVASAALEVVETRVGRIAEMLDRAESSGPRDPYWDDIVDLCRAEIVRALGRSDPERWATVSESWERGGRPADVAYCRYRTAESLIGQRR